MSMTGNSKRMLRSLAVSNLSALCNEDCSYGAICINRCNSVVADVAACGFNCYNPSSTHSSVVDDSAFLVTKLRIDVPSVEKSFYECRMDVDSNETEGLSSGSQCSSDNELLDFAFPFTPSNEPLVVLKNRHYFRNHDSSIFNQCSTARPFAILASY